MFPSRLHINPLHACTDLCLADGTGLIATPQLTSFRISEISSQQIHRYFVVSGEDFSLVGAGGAQTASGGGWDNVRHIRKQVKRKSLQIEGRLKSWWQTAGDGGAQDGLVWNCVCEDDVGLAPGAV